MASTSGQRRRRLAPEALFVLAGLLLVSIAIRFLDLDRRLSACFYDPQRIPVWWAKGRPLLEAVYHFAPWPANLTAAGAFLVLLVSLFRLPLQPSLRRHRRACAVLVLSLVLGPGLLVNGILKPVIGRPRPRDTVEFGGAQAFRPIGSIQLFGKGRAFPSGHVAMGCYFFALYILWRRSRPRAARTALAASLAVGGIVGFQRVGVGAHFLSDVIGTGGIGYLVPLCLDAWLPADRERAAKGTPDISLAGQGTPGLP